MAHERLWRRRVDRLRQFGHRAAAVVVGYQDQSDLSDSGSTNYPLLQFKTPDGYLVTAPGDLGGALCPEIGEQVTVLFDPERPDKPHIDSADGDVTSSVIGAIGWMLIFGAPMIAVPVLVIMLSMWP